MIQNQNQNVIALAVVASESCYRPGPSRLTTPDLQLPASNFQSPLVPGFQPAPCPVLAFEPRQ